MVRTLGIIPARMGSTRFPKKVLFPILEKPMIQYVWEACARAQFLDEVLVATDDPIIQSTVLGFGGKAVLTPSHFTSGSDRVAWVAAQTNASIVVNIQGDEPLISPAAIDSLAAELLQNPQTQISTLCTRANTQEQGGCDAVVKVFFGPDGLATSFSRRLPRDYTDNYFYKHIGIYAFRRAELLHLCQLPQSPLEKQERLEQLRALECGMKIRVIESPFDTIAVDHFSDIVRVEAHLKEAIP